MAEEEVAVAAETAVSPVASDHKRKLEDLEPQEAPSEPVVSSLPPSDDPPQEDSNANSNEVQISAPEVKRPRLEEESDGPAAENGHELQKLDVTPTENGQKPTVGNLELDNAQPTMAANLYTENVEHPSMENTQMEKAQQPSVENLQTVDAQHPLGGDLEQPIAEVPQQGDLSFAQQQPPPETQTMSRKMEVPNNKVGVLIGKSGDTIRFLQYNSGAKIQITRDAEADPYSSTRPVELIGSLENINKAEKLIKDVIAEADAGGSPSLVARGFGTVQASGAAEQIHIQVPNEKVGLIIGKGGETIKSLQTRSGARIQLIPQHLPEGDQSKERTVRVTGDKKQIEMAREMIKEVMNQPVRSSPLSGGYNQQNYRPRGPTGPPQWGPRAPPTAPATGHDYQQRGMYPSQNPQYPPPTYGGYPPHQPPPRSGFNAGWDQRPSGPVQAPPQSGGYDYYGQGGGHVADAPAPVTVSSVAPAPASAVGAPPTQVNYNYGQPQGPDYGQPTTYSQSAPPQQSYGHGYEEPKYGNQVLTQPAYGGHGNAQPGAYSQQVNTQQSYAQQPYAKPPTYGMPSQGPPQTYGPPRGGQPGGDVPYQGPPTTHSYGSNVPSQQPYPYASSGPTQQTYPYGATPTANDGYNQPSTLTASNPSYTQQGGQPVSGYGQPGGQTAYAQVGQSSGYGPYPSSQQAYGEQQVANNVSYGYQGPADTGYNGGPTTAYGAPPSGQASYVQPTSNQPGAQANYVQPTSNQPSYEQPMPYGGVPGSAPVGYVKNLSPQTGYTQYDSAQMYGAHH